MRVAVLALLLVPGVASAQMHRTVFDDVASGERSVRMTAGGMLSGNSLNAAQLAAVGRIAAEFTPGDALLLGGLTPEGAPFRIGSASGATVLLTLPGQNFHVGLSASARVTADGYIPASLTTLVSGGLQDTTLTIDLDGLAATSMMRAEAAMHVLRHRPRHSLGLGLRVARAVPIADVELKGIGGGEATVDVQGSGITSAFSIIGPRSSLAVLGDAYYERRVSDRVALGMSALGFGVTRVSRNTAAREVLATAQTWSEFTDMLDSVRAGETLASSSARFEQPRILIAARFTDGPLAVHITAGKPYDGAPVSAVQVRGARKLSVLELTAGTVLTRYGAGWAGGASLHAGALLLDVRAAGDGGMRIERGRNMIVSSTIGFVF